MLRGDRERMELGVIRGTGHGREMGKLWETKSPRGGRDSTGAGLPSWIHQFKKLKMWAWGAGSLK